MGSENKCEIYVYRITKESDITPKVIEEWRELFGTYSPRELRNYFLDNCKETKDGQ